MRLPLDDIVIDPDIQLRNRLDAATFERYIEMLEVSEPPPVVVFDGNLLADGFHRVASSKKAGRKEIRAERKEGGRKEAIAYAVTANTGHGLPLTRAERNRGIKRLLELGWTQQHIAEAMKIAREAIADIDNSLRLKGKLTAAQTKGKKKPGRPKREIKALPENLRGIDDTKLYRIATLPDAQQEPVARVVVEEGLDEPQTRKVVKAVRAEPTIDLRAIRKEAVAAAEKRDPWIALHTALEAGEHLTEFDVTDLAAQVRRPERAVWLARLDTTIDILQRIRATVEETALRAVK